jgi:hypothetical protein
MSVTSASFRQLGSVCGSTLCLAAEVPCEDLHLCRPDSLAAVLAAVLAARVWLRASARLPGPALMLQAAIKE